ncbi:hypothetical protein KCP74_21220 [Salmonella enterica subsp. enterica]|nr:hypothetical protein KCP74_21220 [Salmonella enterica subsp. enterica]
MKNIIERNVTSGLIYLPSARDLNNPQIDQYREIRTALTEWTMLNVSNFKLMWDAIGSASLAVAMSCTRLTTRAAR